MWERLHFSQYLAYMGLRPLRSDTDTGPHGTPTGFDAAGYHLTGNVTGEPPFRGRMTHHGWQATRCELPAFSGGEAAARTVAPVEVELK